MLGVRSSSRRRVRGALARDRRRRRGDRPHARLARAGGDPEPRHDRQAIPDRRILVASALLGAALGILAARRFVFGVAGIAFMAAVGTAASFRDPQTDGVAPLWLGVAGAAAGIATLWLLLRELPRDVGRAHARRRRGDRPAPLPRARRRRVLVASLGAVGGRMLRSDRVDVDPQRDHAPAARQERGAAFPPARASRSPGSPRSSCRTPLLPHRHRAARAAGRSRRVVARR